MTLTTKTLIIIPCNAEISQAGIRGNEGLAEVLSVELPDHWTEFGSMAFQYALDMLQVDTITVSWLT